MTITEAILEQLDDLQHDLGKYIVLPVTLLPRDADQDELRSAVHTALMETRRGPTGVQSAEQLWTQFCDVSGNRMASSSGWKKLCDAVGSALAWSKVLKGQDQPIDREELIQDLRAVGVAIRVLQDQFDD